MCLGVCVFFVFIQDSYHKYAIYCHTWIKIYSRNHCASISERFHLEKKMTFKLNVLLIMEGGEYNEEKKKEYSMNNQS